MNPRFWVQRRCFLVNFAKFIMTPILRILSGKKQRQIKLQCLQKVPISTFGSLTHQINSLSSETEIDFSKNWSSYWQNTILCDRSVLYSPFHLSYPYSGWGFSGLLMDRRGGADKKAPLTEICHTYPTTTMKLGRVVPYPRKIKKIYKSRDTPLEFCWHQHFLIGNQQILLYQEIQI